MHCRSPRWGWLLPRRPSQQPPYSVSSACCASQSSPPSSLARAPRRGLPLGVPPTKLASRTRRTE
eukprot:13331935-Alexandrium_andersonii.AAC.1